MLENLQNCSNYDVLAVHGNSGTGSRCNEVTAQFLFEAIMQWLGQFFKRFNCASANFWWIKMPVFVLLVDCSCSFACSLHVPRIRFAGTLTGTANFETPVLCLHNISRSRILCICSLFWGFAFSALPLGNWCMAGIMSLRWRTHGHAGHICNRLI